MEVPMERFIHDENLKLYKRRLADPTIGEAERERIRKLLAEEEAKHAASPHLSQASSPDR